MTTKRSEQEDGQDNSPAADVDLTSATEESLGGVQGTEPELDSGKNTQVAKPGIPVDQPAPDSGEIEWAGQVVKKPPSPQR